MPRIRLTSLSIATVGIKSSTTQAASKLKLIIDDSAGCASAEESLTIAKLTAVACVGFTAVSDPSTVTLYVDLIQGPPELQTVQLAMSNSVPPRRS